MTKYKFN